MAARDGSVTVPVISPLIAADWRWASGWIVAVALATKARSRIILGIEFLMVHFLVRGPTVAANDFGLENLSSYRSDVASRSGISIARTAAHSVQFMRRTAYSSERGAGHRRGYANTSSASRWTMSD